MPAENIITITNQGIAAQQRYHIYFSLYQGKVPCNVWVYNINREQNLKYKIKTS